MSSWIDSPALRQGSLVNNKRRNSREGIITTLNHKEPDRVPLEEGLCSVLFTIFNTMFLLEISSVC